MWHKNENDILIQDSLFIENVKVKKIIQLQFEYSNESFIVIKNMTFMYRGQKH